MLFLLFLLLLLKAVRNLVPSCLILWCRLSDPEISLLLNRAGTLLAALKQSIILTS